jgi:PAS domain S-box-containing protein
MVRRAVAELTRLDPVTTALLGAKTPGDIATVVRNEGAQLALQLLRGVTEGTTDAVFVKDQDARYLMMNSAGAASFGMSVEEVLGKHDDELFIEQSASVMRARDAAIMASRQTVTYETTSVTAAGEKRTWLSTRGPYLDRHGEVIGLIGVSRDITERKNAEEAQRLLAEVSGILASSLEDGESTLEEVVNLLVPAFTDACAVHVVEPSLSGQPLVIKRAGATPEIRASGEDSLACLPDGLVATALAGGRLVTTCDLDDGTRSALTARGLRSLAMVPVVVRGRPLACVSFASKELDHLTSPLDRWLTQEIARRVGLALESNRLYRDAQRANRLKDEFLGVVSHELRTPLTAVLGWTSILRRGPVSQDVLARALATIERNALAQARLIEDLMDGSGIMAGKLSVELGAIEVFPLLEAAVEALRSSALSKEIRLVTTLEREGASVLGDATRLQQIVSNLLSNAIKFTPRGGTIAIRTWIEGTAACLQIKDDGEGITPELLPHIFDRFRQGDSSKTRRHGGLGLGLAIVRHLVEAHGGAASAESAGSGRGATFTVKLPLVAPASPREPCTCTPDVPCQPFSGALVLLGSEDSAHVDEACQQPCQKLESAPLDQAPGHVNDALPAGA